MNKSDGGPAFARTLSAEERHSHAMSGWGPAPFAQDGMTLRDYFAAKAMQGFVLLYKPSAEPAAAEMLAKFAYQQADAMLAAREAK